MANFTKNYETTGGMGGARPLNTYDLDLPLGNVVETKPYTNIKFDINSILGTTSQTKVLCKDGTFGYDISSPNAKYDNSKVCINNGGRAENQSVTNAQAQANSQANNTKEPIYYILVTAGVLVAGYFAYKKFKK
jgi:hypothetical protein